jgi:hypothetical protein
LGAAIDVDRAVDPGNVCIVNRFHFTDGQIFDYLKRRQGKRERDEQALPGGSPVSMVSMLLGSRMRKQL